MINYEQFEHGMIGLFDVKLTDVFPDKSVETECLSYAVYMIMQQIRKYTERLFIYGNIDNLPGDILDYLAKDRNLPYYDSEFTLEKKRNLIKNSYEWYMKAGTVEGIEELIQILFETGNVMEWFDFSDEEKEKGLFDININSENITADALQRFTNILKNAKNVSRHLRKVNVNYDCSYDLNVVSKGILSDSIIIR